MGQKANPIGLRLGIIKGWDSNWYGGKNFSDKLVEDFKIRNYAASLYRELGKKWILQDPDFEKEFEGVLSHYLPASRESDER